MTESEYNRLVEDVLSRIEMAADATDDIECERMDSVLELTFENDAKIIVNRQAANQEIWLAAKAGGFHFAWRENAWRNTRDGEEFFAALSRHASASANRSVTF